MIVSGRPAAVVAQGKTEEEMERRLGAALIAGDPLISTENCETGLGGELLCQVLTQPMLKVRLLGKSLNIEVPNTAAVHHSNNLTMAGETTRHAIRSTLDAGVERPELREFDHHPVATVAATRGDYVAAALTTVIEQWHTHFGTCRVSAIRSIISAPRRLWFFMIKNSSGSYLPGFKRMWSGMATFPISCRGAKRWTNATYSSERLKRGARPRAISWA